ncbi:nucleotidyltransferase domain-containing protein [Marinicella meishanensis]|uniref:nucleotidyltransferase domain-containing protein n=1 Tax=Marinicella meishanensis TaxID=2873263 RepID=UPI001CBB1B90|nr:nucleotidyltransferase [Marinicella sp. NBU2979]
MKQSYNEEKLLTILENIQLSETLYQKAKDRYSNLHESLTTPESNVSAYAPDIFPQGSFRLGTAIKPYNKGDAYDIDLGLILTSGLNKSNITQCDLRKIVKKDLEKYVESNGIKEGVNQKRRCLTINYQDGISFHMDIVPGIPQDKQKMAYFHERMLRNEGGVINEQLANIISDKAIAITDNESDSYEEYSDDWEPSNPQGYAKWFDARMSLNSNVITESLTRNKVATVEELKPYQWNSPLQKAIMLLKRHRDVQYADDGVKESKPISIIITTLAAISYQGESTVEETLLNILDKMESFINNHAPLVPNPVNPDEDFADKWYSEKHKDLELELNFRSWFKDAQRDFRSLLEQENELLFESSVNRKFNIKIANSKLKSLGLKSAAPVTVSTPISADSAPSHAKIIR